LIIKERGFLRVLSGCVNGEVISKALRVRAIGAEFPQEAGGVVLPRVFGLIGMRTYRVPGNRDAGS
jgi:hypothetical protein